MLGVKQPDSDGDYPYYSTYSPNATKVWYPAEVAVLLGHAGAGRCRLCARSLLCAPMTASRSTCMRPANCAPPENVKLVQTTAYPAEETISIRVDASTSQPWTLRLRIPGWLEQPAQITVNGAPAASDSRTRQLRRSAPPLEEWRCGSTAPAAAFRAKQSTISIPTWPPSCVVRLCWWPSIRRMGWRRGLSRSMRVSARLAPGSGTWVRNEDGQQVVFLPFHQVQNERYTTYFNRG